MPEQEELERITKAVRKKRFIGSARRCRLGIGYLFPVTSKNTEQCPDVTGCWRSASNVVYELAGWSRRTRKGKPFFYLSVKPARRTWQIDFDMTPRELRLRNAELGLNDDE